MGTAIPLALLPRRDNPWQCPLFELFLKEDSKMFFNNFRYENISPEDLRQKMQKKADFFLLDVRTPQENAAQAIEGSYLIPINELPYRVGELPRDKEIVVYCRIGNRSAYACVYLNRLGFRVKNLEGGIVLWNMTSGRDGNNYKEAGFKAI